MNTINRSLKASRNVVHVVQHLAPGGLESLALDLLTFANPADKVLIISLEGNKKDAIENWPRLAEFSKQIIFVDKKPGIHFQTVLALSKLFSLIKPDVVHTHHIGPLLYGGYAARLSRVPVRIHTEHDVWHLNNQKHRNLQALALRIAKPTLVADADKVELTLKRHFGYENTVTIKNGIDCEKFTTGSQILARQKLGIAIDKTIVGTAGRLEVVKGHDLAIKAMSLLPDSYHLVVAGDGSQRAKLEQLVQHLGLQEQVTFLGLVSEMPRFYQSLDLFCMPSRSEGFPLSPLEAQACGIRAVVTDVGASSETLCPQTGRVMQPENIVAIARAIANSMNKPSNVSPRQFVLNNNDVRQMVKAYEQLATEVLA